MANPHQTFRITLPVKHTAGGAGTEWVAGPRVYAGHRGRLTGMQIRRDAGDTVSQQVEAYWVQGEDDDLSEQPKDDNVVAKAVSTPVALTASDKDASLDTDLDKPRKFRHGLRFGGLFTFGGAGESVTWWTIWGVLEG